MTRGRWAPSRHRYPGARYTKSAALGSARREGNGIVITRDELHRAAQINVPWVTGKLNIGARDTTTTFKALPDQPASPSKPPLARSSTEMGCISACIRVSTRISTCISSRISNRVAHRRPNEIDITDMAHEYTHVIDVYLPVSDPISNKHPARPAKGTPHIPSDAFRWRV